MMELHLVEERSFAGFWVTGDGLAYLPDTQTIRVCPFASHPRLGAGLFYFVPALGVKELLPADVETGREVSNVHQTLLFEFLQNLGVHTAHHFSTIRQRGCSALLRRLRAIKIDLLRPA